MSYSFSTDTASMCIFDFAELKHGLKSKCDWWASRFEELEELNKGNAIIVGLLTDGRYIFRLSKSDHFSTFESSLFATLNCSIGQIFLGPGEDITGDDDEPDEDDGLILTIPSGIYNVQVCILDEEYLGGWF